jgi:hypothetical protein
MNIPDHISESLETIFWVKMPKSFDVDVDPGIFLALDPEKKKFGSGSGINNLDPQHCFLLSGHGKLVGVLI